MKNLIRKYRKFNLRQQDILASNLLLSPILARLNNYLPVNKYSLRPSSVGLLLNDIAINGRKHILEFGAGISTILFAKFCQMQEIDAQIHTIDHDERWLEWLESFLTDEQLKRFVQIKNIPLKKNEQNPFNQTLEWYDKSKLKDSLSDNRYDLVLIDGPPGRGGFHRYYAVPFIMEEYLQEKYLIVLDDVNRDAEKQILQQWKNEYNLDFKIVNHKIALSYRGPFYDPQLD